MTMRRRQAGRLLLQYCFFLALLGVSFVLLTALINSGLKTPHFPQGLDMADDKLHAQIRLGDLNPAAPGDADSQAGWEALASVLGSSAADRYEGVYWVRMTYRDLDMHSPRVWTRGIPQYEVYVNGTSVLDFNNERPNPRVSTFTQFRLVPLPSEGTILFRFVAGKDGVGVHINSVMIVDADDAYAHILRQNAVKIILGVVFAFMAAVSLFAYLTNRHNPLFLYFGLLSLGQGFGCFVRSEALNYYVDASAVSYYYPLAWPFSMVAYLAFLEKLYGAGYLSIVRRARQLMLACFLVSAAFSWANQEAYDWLTGPNYQFLLVLVLAGVSFSILRSKREKPEGTIEWMLLGNGIIFLLWIQRWLLSHFYALQEWIFERFPLYSFYWQPNIGYIAGFIFALCTARVLASYLGDMQKQLAKLNEGLEEQVKERTADLERMHVQLQESMREKFEALGEVALLEERNRISHEIHDILGHKLIGTIIQMEAARRLMDKDMDTAQAKLDSALESVRKGLSDVRTAVRLMKDDFANRDLVAYLNELMDDTEKMTGVTIERSMTPLPPLDPMRKKTIYHALQEGITNGIKHGGCRQFHFSLQADGEWLTFLLYNDGVPVASVPRGFGLSSMHDRIRRLGGSVELRPSEDVLPGSVLKIRMPIREPEAS